MFSPERFGKRSFSFSHADQVTTRPYVGLRTAFPKGGTGKYTPVGVHSKDKRTPLQKAAHFRFSEPTTPSVLKDRGLRPSDLSDPHKKEFLKNLTTKVFHLALEHEEEKSREKIPLERLFTPATDTGEIIPQKKKKAFASSCFYRPDHPTIDDQVELAHKISVSLVDDHNKSSKGQTMYIKRKNRSSKWIHQGEEMEIAKAAQLDMEEAEEEKKPLLEKPPLKLVLNPKGMQDYAEVNRYYEELMMSSSQTTQEITRIEVGKEIATNLESPTGKGAALFAKRKKRMDKFIIDETSVRHQPPGLMQEDVVTKDVNTFSHQDTFNSAVGHEKSRASTLNNGPAFLDSTPVVPPEGGAIYKAEVKVVQNTSLPRTTFTDLPLPVSPAPSYTILDHLSTSKEEEKRKSFNLAAKGWGTYSAYYTPVHLGAV